MRKNYEFTTNSDFERKWDHQETLETLIHLRDRLKAVDEELAQPELPDTHRSMLREERSNITQALEIARESLKALSQEDALTVIDTTLAGAPLLRAEVRDPEAYFKNLLSQTKQELEELLKERDVSEKRGLAENDQSTQMLTQDIRQLETRIQTLETALHLF